MIAFFRVHDLAFRIRRLRLLARQVTLEREADEHATELDRDKARTAIYDALALYLAKEPLAALGSELSRFARDVIDNPEPFVTEVARQRALVLIDAEADRILAQAMDEMPPPLRRRMLFAYLGFPFYDTVTLPLLRSESLTEFDPVRVDRISPEDCYAIRNGDTERTLRGTEFFNFGAFFSRAYRENDYLWGRLHGAERMIDLIASTLETGRGFGSEALMTFKREAFLAILDEEQHRLQADPDLVPRIRREVLSGSEH